MWFGPNSRPVAIAAVLLMALMPVSVAPTAAQDDSPPGFAALIGVGHDMGWFGAQAEGYVRPGLAIFGGLGWTPEIRDDTPTGPTFAFGVRQYVGSARHRGFLEANVSQVLVITADSVSSGDRFYGPGLQAGYSFVSQGGLSALVSAGLGYAVGLDPAQEGDDFALLFGLGVGYTWRQ